MAKTDFFSQLESKLAQLDEARAELEGAKEEVQQLLWNHCTTKGIVNSSHQYVDKHGNFLGIGPKLTATKFQTPDGEPFEMFTRFNKSAGKPTIVIKGLWAEEKEEQRISL